MTGEIDKTLEDLNSNEIIDKAEQVLKPVELTPEITKEVTFQEIADILSSTIKRDDAAKLIAFSAMLLAQTETDQINIGFQSESSAGKSYIPMELASYFPAREVVTVAGASPMAFFHDRGEWDDVRKVNVIDLEGKILLFLDQPHWQLLEKLRPLLSHDQKELVYKITDKNKGGQNKTKNIIIRGFPSVAFSTTKMNPDEQEKTRMILLSPSIDQDKIKEALQLLSLKKGNHQEFEKQIQSNPQRAWLMTRIKAIRQTKYREIIVPDHEESVLKRFMEKHQHLMARHQRDFPRIFGLIKAHALLNCFNRECSEGRISATKEDIDAGFKLYESIEESNEAGLSPHIFKIFTEVIKPLLNPEVGLNRKDIQRRYYAVFRKVLAPDQWNRELLPQLEAVGLIVQEPDPEDKRRMLIYPAYQENIVEVQTLDIPKPAPKQKLSEEGQFWETLESLTAILGEVTHNALVGELMDVRKWKQEDAEKMIAGMEAKGKIMGVPNNITRIKPTRSTTID